MGATLLGFGASEWAAAAQSLVGPAAAFAFLYALNIPLKKLPLVEVEVEYKYPEWILPLVALTLVLLCGLCAATAFTLRNSRGPGPDEQRFLHTYFRAAVLTPAEWRKVAALSKAKILKASLTIQTYDGRSNARVFVNGTRVFATYVDCRTCFQCKSAAQTRMIEQGASRCPSALSFSPNLLYANLRTRQLPYNALPLARDFTSLLQGKHNVIEIADEESGLAGNVNGTYIGCYLKGALHFATKRSSDIQIPFTIKPADKAAMRHYGVYGAQEPYRVCDRVRIAF